ncbi:MAG: hypothetical protein WCU00_09525, partial [Candidatus Latescibacterota bacterium]
MNTRREFLNAGAALFTALPVFPECLWASEKDRELAGAHHDPGMHLVRDGLSWAEKGKKNNISPILREEILDNPDAVFVIRTTVASNKESDGKFPAENEQFLRAGHSV